MKKYLFFCLSIFISLSITAQKKITTEDLWRDYTFYTSSIPGFNFMKDGMHYTLLKNNAIEKYSIKSGEKVGTILDGSSIASDSSFDGSVSNFYFLNDERLALLQNNMTSIYRRSFTASTYVYDFKNKTLKSIYEGTPVANVSLNKKGDKAAFVYENNIYTQDLVDGKITQVTNDGKVNEVINGMADWVYEEEFSIVKCYQWSPDGNQIAYIRFDETDVPYFTMTNYKGGLYPEYQTFKYPKVGENNSKVSLHRYTVSTEKTEKIDIGDLDDMYIPRIQYSPKGELIAYKMNRHQNDLKLYSIASDKKKGDLLLHETNKYYIDIHDNLTFIKDGFLWTSEKDGFNHIYLYDHNGKEKRQITKGKYEITDFYGYDADRKTLYYQSNEGSPLRKNVYSIDIKGKKKRLLTKEGGSNRAQFSTNYDYYVVTHSDLNTAPTYKVYDRKGNVVRVIKDNVHVAGLQETYGTAPAEFFDFTTTEGVNLNGYMIKPADFNPNLSYPLFMVQYSGPGSQSVTDSWQRSYWWYQQLAQEGIIVACVDPRGTGGRGEEFKKMTYLKLGHYETIDLIEAAKYLGNQNYIDQDRIGIYGWSYGGYMSSLALLKGNDVFSTAIAVAPVTSWRWYDTIYTERYMRTEEENPDGYAENSPVYFADQLKGNYLLIHGMSDDNVHFQNAAEMAEALIRANKQYDTYYYPNRNHGIYGNNGRLHLFTKINNYLKEKL